MILLVIATFIITGVFVGYHASMEAQEGTVEGHSQIIEMKSLNSPDSQKLHILNIHANPSK
ncbi:MAG: hypothetical protein ACE5Q5_04450 [Nitrosarchaeum sp.]